MESASSRTMILNGGQGFPLQAHTNTAYDLEQTYAHTDTQTYKLACSIHHLSEVKEMWGGRQQLTKVQKNGVQQDLINSNKTQD